LLVHSESELTSEIMNSFIYFGRSFWMGDWPITGFYIHRTAHYV